MKLFLQILAGGYFLLGLSVVSFAQGKTADENDVRQLKAIYKEFDEASKKLDIKTTEKYLDENYILETGETKASRAEVVSRVKQFFAMTEKITEATSKIEKVKVADGKYFLEVSSVTKGILKTADGKSASFEFKGKSTDIWTKTDARWKEIRQIDLGVKFYINGKEIPM
jgi:ketosteroid isomerase-like protein